MQSSLEFPGRTRYSGNKLLCACSISFPLHPNEISWNKCHSIIVYTQEKVRTLVIALTISIILSECPCPEGLRYFCLITRVASISIGVNPVFLRYSSSTTDAAITCRLGRCQFSDNANQHSPGKKVDSYKNLSTHRCEHYPSHTKPLQLLKPFNHP